jgi:2-dehydro-3-deoxyphosphogluconate aldolase/(4S)-4-hydroxy-2-oxoglutarate aldolase
MNSLIPTDILKRLEDTGVIAVLVLDEVDHAVPVAEALLAGGVSAMELTLRTPVAIDALKAIRENVPGMLAGIGTILTPDQVDQAVDADAAFGVSPGLNPRVVEHAKSKDLPFAPGIVTPSDIEHAIELGCRELKFFPAEASGGLPYLKNIAAPFAHLSVRFIPLGGINADNMLTYLKDNVVPAIGGSWLAPRDLIQAQDWPAITARASQARKLIDESRGH